MKLVVSRSLEDLSTRKALGLEGFLCILYYIYSLMEVSISLLHRGFPSLIIGFSSLITFHCYREVCISFLLFILLYLL